MWQNINFNGAMLGVIHGCHIADLRNYSCPSCTNGIHGNDGTFNDQMSSWFNNSGGRSCWWYDIHRGGQQIVMPNGARRNEILPPNNDQASSFGSC
jgi:hypothetical protein